MKIIKHSTNFYDYFYLENVEGWNKIADVILQ